MIDQISTRALRERSPELLRDGLLVLMDEGREDYVADYRDLLVAMAPAHDCVRRLGLDPAAFFAEVAAEAPADLRELVIEFGQRTDVNEQSFSFMLDETPEGPEYWHVPYGVDLRVVPRDEREDFIRKQTEDLIRFLGDD